MSIPNRDEVFSHCECVRTLQPSWKMGIYLYDSNTQTEIDDELKRSVVFQLYFSISDLFAGNEENWLYFLYDIH